MCSIASSSGRASRNSRPNRSWSVRGRVERLRCLERADVEQLAGVVPVVQGVGDVDALVALQPDQAPAGDERQRLRRLRLAHPGLALEEHRLLERECEREHGRKAAVGQIGVFGELRGERVDGERFGHARLDDSFHAARLRQIPAAARQVEAAVDRRS